MKQKLDKKLNPYMFYVDIVFIVLGLVLAIWNLILSSYVAYTYSLTIAFYTGLVLVFYGLINIKKDYHRKKNPNNDWDSNKKDDTTSNDADTTKITTKLKSWWNNKDG